VKYADLAVSPFGSNVIKIKRGCLQTPASDTPLVY